MYIAWGRIASRSLLSRLYQWFLIFRLLVRMPHSKWPSHVDMSEDEARRSLRGLELNAYSSLVAVFRAQGDLTPQKKQILTQLQTMLGYVSS